MLKKLGIAFLVFVLVLGAVGVGGYFWVKTRLWSEIQSVAREHGAELQQPDLQLGWRGGLRFTITLKNLRGELKAPLPVTGTFTLPLLDADVELTDERRRAVIYHAKIEGLSGDFHRVAGPVEEAPPKDDFEIPTVEVPAFDRPELPLAVDLRDLDLQTAEIRFRQTGEGTELEAQSTGTRIKISGQADERQTNFAGSVELKPLRVSQSSTTPEGTSQARAEVRSVQLNFESKSPEAAPRRLQPKLEARAEWSQLQFAKTPKVGTPLTLEDGGGEFTAQAEGADFQMRGQGKNLRASPLKKPTDWGFELKPLAQTATERAYRLTTTVPGLLDLKLNARVPVNFDPATPELKADGEVSAHSDLSLLVLDQNPSPWKSRLDGKFNARLARSGDVSLTMQLRGDGVSLDLQSELNPRAQEAQATGFVSLHFKDKQFQYAGIKPQGRVSAPFKLLLRQKRKFFFESELRLGAFSVATPDLRIEAMQGSLPVKQAWSYVDGRWTLSPKLSPNAFGRADFESFEPLDTRLNQLRIAQIVYQKRNYGPVSLDLKFEQNLLRSGSWSAVVGQGSIEGALQADLSLDNPRMGLLMRAFDVKLEELLPESMFRSAQKSERGLSFRLGMDWDLGKATAVGRLDWSEINSAQVLQVLDFLDPQFENATFNQARMVLAQAYPTRVQVEMRGPVADVRISTNLVALPEVRNVAISPYLVKANEALYSSEVYRNLRASGKPAVRKEPSP